MQEVDAIDQLDEPAMFRACLRVAMEDATCPNPSAYGGGGRTSFEEVADARRWLLSPLNPWREDRRLICTLAGYDSERVEKRAREILNPMLAREAEAESERVESNPERAEREALAEHLDLGGSIKARGWMRKGLKKRARAKQAAPKPAAPQPAPPQWSAAEFLEYVIANEGGLLALGELHLALEEAGRREIAELERMASRRENAHAKRYIETYTPAIAAE
jgi:hypothetical protein